MAFSLFDRDQPFLALLDEQRDALLGASERLRAMLRDGADISVSCREIHDECARGQEASRRLLRELSLVQIRPLERSDVLELHRAYQEALQSVRSVAARLGLYHFVALPRAAGEVAAGLAEMAALLTGLQQSMACRVGDTAGVREATRLREEAGMFLLVALGELYETKPSTPAEVLEIIKMTQLLDRLEETVLRLEQVAVAIEAVLLKNL